MVAMDLWSGKKVLKRVLHVKFQTIILTGQNRYPNVLDYKIRVYIKFTGI
jgi:hypothetical protein